MLNNALPQLYAFIFIVIISEAIIKPPFYISSIAKSWSELHNFPENFFLNYNWTVKSLPHVPVDHFSYSNSKTFSLKYLINVDNFQSGGPIFFYTGNEGAIESFASNIGLMWDLSRDFNALVIFAEHRFYGETLPFGNESYTKLSNLGYLSSEQALADYALLVNYLKASISGAENSPVLAFGGSYGGMLAAWFRIKYPHIITGALASSAPIFQFPGMNISQGIFDHIATRTFLTSGCNKSVVLKAWDAIDYLAKTGAGIFFCMQFKGKNSDKGRRSLNAIFRLAKKSHLKKESDAQWLKYWIKDCFETMAMLDYPYFQNFLIPLPPWPVEAACMYLSSNSSTEPEDLARSLYQIANIYYNSTGEKREFCANFELCHESAFSSMGSPLGWPWQACTEMTMPMVALGPPSDFFWKEQKWTEKSAYLACSRISNPRTGVNFAQLGYNPELFRSNWIIDNFGATLSAASNIIFSNGLLDPWSGGGVNFASPGISPLSSKKHNLYVFLIEKAAHHLDLRQPNSCDPESVKKARFRMYTVLECWVNGRFDDCKVPNFDTLRSSKMDESPEHCRYVYHGYPWAQSSSVPIRCPIFLLAIAIASRVLFW